MAAENSKNSEAPASFADETICPATLSDYEAVINIDRNVYSGLDYLSSLYKDVVQTPGMSPYLYKKEDRVVGFIVVSFVDGGQTLVTSSGRIAPDCRAGGMFSRFKRRVFQDYRASRDLRHVAFTTNNTNMASNGHKILRMYTIMEEREITTYTMNLPEAKRRAPKQLAEYPGLRQLSRADIHAMMSRHPSDLKHLFPQERVTVEWKPHGIMAANTDSVFGGPGQQRICLASSPENGEPQNKYFPGTLLTFGGYYPSNLGVRYQLDVYGSGSEEQMRAHFDRHFLRLIQNCDEQQAIIQILFHRNLSDVLNGMKADYCIKESGLPLTKMYILEAPYAVVSNL